MYKIDPPETNAINIADMNILKFYPVTSVIDCQNWSFQRKHQFQKMKKKIKGLKYMFKIKLGNTIHLPKKIFKLYIPIFFQQINLQKA